MFWFDPVSYYTLLLIFSKAKFRSFYRHYLSSSNWDDLRFSSRVPYFWSIWIFFAIIDLAFPSFGSGNIIWRLGDVPNILFLMNFLSFIKFPLGPSISDYKNINLPLILLWSNTLSTNNNILSNASSFAPNFNDYYDKNSLGYWIWKK